MNQGTQYIKNRLSLRDPQKEALDILAEICEILPLSKNNNLEEEVAKIRHKYPIFKEFERNFPSVCFSLATGVGKTRLMGAFICYLHAKYQITDFFVLAPNLTIYNKLIDDLSKPNNPKYVFKGISDFAVNPPLIITGENYREMTENQLFKESIRINIFNISKINAESRKGEDPKIKRLSEYLGQSYFEYLSGLEKLVLLMDESHHYRADRGMQVINELNPILGLEVTATPQVENGSKTIKFGNVVYEYSLAKAIRDGYVKKPYVATRKNFDPSKYSDEEIDRIKVEDGIRIHHNTAVELDKYSRNYGVRLVKPFVLIVTKDTDHANKIKEMIQSDSFFNGYYKNKVIEVHSNQKGKEKDENIEQLLYLEDPNNKIEIVIHVNMLKEGWDVTNLYTIVPLRASASATLTEQTIGRGLRLPYGKQTGEAKVDALTIVSHDKFQAIIEEANKPDSLIKRENIIDIEEENLSNDRKVVVTSKSNLEIIRENWVNSTETKSWSPSEEEFFAVATLQDKILPQMAKEASVQNIEDLNKQDIQKIAFEKLKNNLQSKSLFANEIIENITSHAAEIVKQYVDNTISIPRVTIQPGKDGYFKFNDFELDCSNLLYQPVSEEIFRKSLSDGGFDFIRETSSGYKDPQALEKTLVSALIDLPEISYDENADLLFSLSNQVIKHFKTYLSVDAIQNVIFSYKRDISDFIFTQMKSHATYLPPDFSSSEVYPFTEILPHNYDKISSDKIYHYMDTIEPVSAIPSKIFTGFKKSCHDKYKFDSKAEKDFTQILETDTSVQKWLRPADRQLNIYWSSSKHLYTPDFVAETDNDICLIEIKSAKDILDSREVEEKARAALTWISSVNNYAKKQKTKYWKYLLIPHIEVKTNNSFDYFYLFHKQ